MPANVPPKPVSSTIMVNLAPGATPPAIRLSQGYVSSLVFVDSAGSPWLVASSDLQLDPKATTIQWDNKSNILLIQALSPYSDGNLVVNFVGLPYTYYIGNSIRAACCRFSNRYSCPRYWAQHKRFACRYTVT